MKQLATAFLALLVCAFIVDPASAQFQREWEKSKAQGNAPSYISSGTDYYARGIAYGTVDDGTGTMVERVLVASTAGSDPINVVVVDPSDGTLLDSLDVSTVDNTFRDLNDVGISNDGIIYACNLALGPFGNEPLKCYRWDSLTDTPTKVIDGPGWTGERMGSHISVTGAAADNSLQIHTASVSSDTLVQFNTADNGASFSTDTLYTTEEGATPNVEDAYPLPGGGYYHTWINEPADQYDSNDAFVDSIYAAEMDSLTSLQVFTVDGKTYLAGTKNHYAGGSPQGSDSRVRIADVSNGPTNATFYGETSDLGNTQQFQGNGDVDVRVNSDGTATVFFLSTNNGIGAFTTSGSPLPVELATFTGTQAEEGGVQLSWTTASETNNAGFRVQHQTDEGQWRTLDFVDSKAESGTTTQATSYRFAVRDLAAGTHRFRLKQVDLNGETTLSTPVSVELGVTDDVQLSAPAPNPVSTTATVTFAVQDAAETTITLYNVLGQEVRTLYRGTSTAGDAQTLQVSTDGLSSGTYLMRMEADGETKTRRMTVVK